MQEWAKRQGKQRIIALRRSEQAQSDNLSLGSLEQRQIGPVCTTLTFKHQPLNNCGRASAAPQDMPYPSLHAVRRSFSYNYIYPLAYQH